MRRALRSLRPRKHVHEKLQPDVGRPYSRGRLRVLQCIGGTLPGLLCKRSLLRASPGLRACESVEHCRAASSGLLRGFCRSSISHGLYQDVLPEHSRPRLDTKTFKSKQRKVGFSKNLPAQILDMLGSNASSAAAALRSASTTSDLGRQF